MTKLPVLILQKLRDLQRKKFWLAKIRILLRKLLHKMRNFQQARRTTATRSMGQREGGRGRKNELGGELEENF